MTALPHAEALTLPEGYGQPSGRTLPWNAVSQRLTEAPRYWLATVRPDRRPHIVPTDGLWVDDELWFGGGGETVHLSNLRLNPSAAAHLEDGRRAVIVEGRAEPIAPSAEQIRGLVELSVSKYGFAPPPAAYRTGLWRLSPWRVLAWDDFPHDATRFRFDRGR